MSTQRNPNAGAAPTEFSELCSAPTEEPLAGTAKPGKIILALEHFGGWGYDILDGDALGQELSAKIKEFLSTHGATLHFIRKPGRAGQERKHLPQRTLFISWADRDTPVLEELNVEGPESILSLDLSHPGANPHARQREGHLLLVCTHGKRDKCCAIFGRPVAQELGERHAEVWESSHVKGHRFAPAMLLLPNNYSYGQLEPAEAEGILTAARNGRLQLRGNRGRGTLDVPGQVAELAVAQLLEEVAPVQLGQLGVGVGKQEGDTKERATRLVTNRPTGACYRVELERTPTVQARASCGKPAKTTHSWVARDISEL